MLKFISQCILLPQLHQTAFWRSCSTRPVAALYRTVWLGRTYRGMFRDPTHVDKQFNHWNWFCCSCAERDASNDNLTFTAWRWIVQNFRYVTAPTFGCFPRNINSLESKKNPRSVAVQRDDVNITNQYKQVHCAVNERSQRSTLTARQFNSDALQLYMQTTISNPFTDYTWYISV